MTTERRPATTADMACADDRRRDFVRTGTRFDGNPGGGNGIDYIEIDPDDPTRLVVVLLRKPSADLVVGASQVRVTPLGDRPGRALRVIGVELCKKADVTLDDCIRVTLDCAPDAGSYRLCLVAGDGADDPGAPNPGLDPLYSCAEFRGDAGGVVDLDCIGEEPFEPGTAELPSIDYMARDYATMRRAILDRLALTMPDWDERHVPDIAMTIVEALAFAGDRLTYFQDAVGTEAYLATARRRISVRRHARLVDHHLHEGTNARAWVVIQTTVDTPPLPADEVFFTTALPVVPPPPVALRSEELAPIDPTGYEVFEPLTGDPRAALRFRRDLNELRIHTWGREGCCLPEGSTSATLVAPSSDGLAGLAAGSVVVFEEVLGPITGLPSDADPVHRHAVRLVADPWPVHDPLAPELALFAVEWAPEDALPFELCVSVTTASPDCRLIRDVSVGRGNVVLVDHGRRVPVEIPGRVPLGTDPGDCATGACPPEIALDAPPVRLTLERGPVVFAAAAPTGPARDALNQEPAFAVPALVTGGLRFAEPAAEGPGTLEAVREEIATASEYLVELAARLTALADDSRSLLVDDADWIRWADPVLLRHLPADLQDALGPGGAPSLEQLADLERAIRRVLGTWQARVDLLASGPDDRDVVVECDDDGRAHLRFGDGDLGAPPIAGTVLMARYRTGGGFAGNLGAETIRHLVLRAADLPDVNLQVRNPMPAVGGLAPETVDHARRHAPFAPGRRLERAVTASDYAALSSRGFERRLQGATAALEWTGSWFEASVALDERGRDEATEVLCAAVELALERYRRMGHDLAVGPAVTVPIEIRLRVCVAVHALRGHVAERLADVFGTRALPGGRRGFFHPDSLEAGKPVRSSHLVAAALRVEGVVSATVEALHRAGRPPSGELEAGILELGPREVARVGGAGGGSVAVELEGGR